MNRFFCLIVLAAFFTGCMQDPSPKRKRRDKAETYVEPEKKIAPHLVAFSAQKMPLVGNTCTFALDSAALAKEQVLIVHDAQSSAVVSVNGRQLTLPLEKGYSTTHRRFGNDSLSVEVRYQPGNRLANQPDEAYKNTGQALLEVRGRVLETYNLVGLCES
jgi:hypothetical protein